MDKLFELLNQLQNLNDGIIYSVRIFNDGSGRIYNNEENVIEHFDTAKDLEHVIKALEELLKKEIDKIKFPLYLERVKDIRSGSSHYYVVTDKGSFATAYDGSGTIMTGACWTWTTLLELILSGDVVICEHMPAKILRSNLLEKMRPFRWYLNRQTGYIYRVRDGDKFGVVFNGIWVKTVPTSDEYKLTSGGNNLIRAEEILSRLQLGAHDPLVTFSSLG
jgi:hypothetical protein